MTKSQIMYFLAVATHLSFSKAAQQYYVSQPAVSKQISQYEEELGFPLFDRTRSGITLTPSGQLMYKALSECLHNYETALEEARQRSATREGLVRIGCLAGWNVENFYPMIKNFFAERNPNLNIQLDGYDSDALFTALRKGDIDVALSRSDHVRGADLETRPLTVCHTNLFYSAHHPLANFPGLVMTDFKNETFYIVAAQEETFARQTTLDICHQFNFEPKMYPLPSLAMAFVKLQSGSGVFIGDDWMAVMDNPLFRRIPLNITYNVNLSWLASNVNEAKNMFVNELLFYYRQHQKDAKK